MTQLWTHAQFTECLGTAFELTGNSDETMEISLKKVAEPKTSGPYQSYSTTFHGPRAIFLRQGTYPLRHPVLGECNVFLVPVGENESQYIYEAIFSYQID